MSIIISGYIALIIYIIIAGFLFASGMWLFNAITHKLNKKNYKEKRRS